jgi:vacuolar-type H+-ATPase subunit I/STV1
LSDDSEDEETPGKDSNLLAFVSSYDSPKESNEYYSESSGFESEKDKLQRVYDKLYIKFMELKEVNQNNVQKLILYETERNKQIERIRSLENELIESQVQLEKFSNDKLVQMLKGQKCSSDKTCLGFDKSIVSNIAFSSKTIFVKPEVAEP